MTAHTLPARSKGKREKGGLPLGSVTEIQRRWGILLHIEQGRKRDCQKKGQKKRRERGTRTYSREDPGERRGRKALWREWKGGNGAEDLSGGPFRGKPRGGGTGREGKGEEG